MKGEKTPPSSPTKAFHKKKTQRTTCTGLHPPTEPCCHLGQRSLYTAAKNLRQVGRLSKSPCVFVGQPIWWAILNIQDHLTAAENLFPKEILFAALILGYLT